MLKQNQLYLSLFLPSSDPDDTLAPPTQDLSISMLDRIQVIRTNLGSETSAKKSIFVFDVKHVYKVLYLATGIVMNFDSCLMDPKVAIW